MNATIAHQPYSPVIAPGKHWKPFSLLRMGPKLGIIFLIAFAAGYGALVEIRGALIQNRHTDVGTYFAAAWSIRIGADPYDAVDQNGWHYTYPPLLAVLLEPLADAPPTMHRYWLLPYSVSVGIWYCLSVLFLVVGTERLATALLDVLMEQSAGVAAIGEALPRWAWRWWTLLFWPVLLCTPAICRSVIRGQVGPLWLMLICMMIADVIRRRPLRAGFWLAGAICLKLIPAFLLIYPLWRRNTRMLAGTGIGLILGLVVIPALAMGPRQCLSANMHYFDSYVRPALTGGRIDPAVEHEMVDPRTSDTNSFVACLMNTGHLVLGTARTYTPPLFARAGHWLIGGALVVFVLWASGFGSRSKWDPINEAFLLSVLSVIMLPLAPVCHPHYYMLMIPLLTTVLATYLGVRGLPSVNAVWVLLLALVPVSHLLTSAPGFQVLRDVGLVTWVAVAVAVAAAWRLRSRAMGWTKGPGINPVT